MQSILNQFCGVLCSDRVIFGILVALPITLIYYILLGLWLLQKPNFGRFESSSSSHICLATFEYLSFVLKMYKQFLDPVSICAKKTIPARICIQVETAKYLHSQHSSSFVYWYIFFLSWSLSSWDDSTFRVLGTQLLPTLLGLATLSLSPRLIQKFQCRKMAWLEFLHAWKRCFSKDWMKSFNNSYGSLGILCLSNVLGFKLDMKVNSLGCTLFAGPWRFLETLWSPSDHSWIGAGNRWILQDALSYFYATELWQTHQTLHFGPMSSWMQ